MTGIRIINSKPNVKSNEVVGKDDKGSSHRVSLIVGAAVLVAAGAVVARFAAGSGAGAEVSSASSAIAAYHDPNSLPGYHASEWGLPRPDVKPAAWADLSALKLYRASEWGALAAVPATWADLNDLAGYRASEWGLTTEKAGDLYHDLMLVK